MASICPSGICFFLFVFEESSHWTNSVFPLCCHRQQNLTKTITSHCRFLTVLWELKLLAPISWVFIFPTSGVAALCQSLSSCLQCSWLKDARINLHIYVLLFCAKAGWLKAFYAACTSCSPDKSWTVTVFETSFFYCSSSRFSGFTVHGWISNLAKFKCNPSIPNASVSLLWL